MRPESWYCIKVCCVCGVSFRAKSGSAKVCSSCRERPCPRCDRPVKKWANGVCELCRSRDRYRANRVAILRYGREYYAKNRELVKSKWATYRKSHPDVIKAGTRRYLDKNRQAIQDRSRVRCEVLRLQIVATYGGKCACCGEAEPKFLCIHHVRGDGKVDRDAGYGGVHLFAKLRRDGWPRSGYELLCHNCNEAIRIVGCCPHQYTRRQEDANDCVLSVR